jgi:5-methylcytosine-specific restriction endonuclease McrA
VRRIQRQAPRSNAWKRWLSDCSKAAEELTQQGARGEKPAIGDLYKRKSIKDEYFFSAGPPFHGKCAYCEAPIRDYQHGDVEHFRPKAGITDENGQPIYLLDQEGQVQIDTDGKPVKHPGYYWLAYDWTNLVPSCSKCNQDDIRQGRRIGKHTRFPVEGLHAQGPKEVDKEKPLLINPLSEQDEDDPKDHLVVDTKTGLMAHRTSRGQACIDIFGLNVRDQLVDDRRKACLAVEALWARLLHGRHDLAQKAEILQEIEAIHRGEKPFTTAQTAVLRELAELAGIVGSSAP